MSDLAPENMMESIAIIGMAGRFPKANNIDQFWQNLRDGVESLSFFSDEELIASGIDPALLQSSSYVKAGMVLEDIELFDAAFFGFNPREVELLDPQHRLFMEAAWQALENAGYDSERYKGAIGLFGGVSLDSYLLSNLVSNQEMIATGVGVMQAMVGNGKDFLPTRVSYKLNLTGPSINVQTACSTSLVATYLASQSLLNYESDMALAGGVTIRVPQKAGYLYQTNGIVSPDGHCRAFDAKAQGTIIGNGVGIVVLKRLSEALEDGDTIYAVIKGGAVNNDGAAKAGFSAPSVTGQAKVITTAQAVAGVDPDDISYIECHGTATPLGDTIELAALKEAFQSGTKQRSRCAIGSVKTNIGHLDAAAGVAGLIKATLSLHHKMLPPSLHFEQPNPKIDFSNSPFYVNAQLAEWKVDNGPRRAGVSAFGIGGTNAHLILEEAPALTDGDKSRPWQLLVLSAKTETALLKMTSNLAEHLRNNNNINLADVAYTLQLGRWVFNHKRVLVCKDREDAINALSTQDAKRLIGSKEQPTNRPVTFMFPGLGDHYVDMGIGLYQHEPTFRDAVDRCAKVLKPFLGLDLREVIYPPKLESSSPVPSASAVPDLRKMLFNREQPADEASQKLNQTWLTQPAMFVIEYSLAQLLISWGIVPQAMIGYSLSEYVVACLAGVFKLEDALILVAKRAKMIQGLPSGSMLAVPLNEIELQPLLGEVLSLAAVNGPNLSVVAGPIEAIDELVEKLKAKEIVCRRLQTSHAFHSKMMMPIADQYGALLRTVRMKPPEIPFISSVTGNWISPAEATNPGYWVKHLCQTVRFGDGIAELWRDGQRIMLEVGPGQSLGSLALQHPASNGAAERIIPSLSYSYFRQPDQEFLLNTLGKLWLAGVNVDWQGFYSHEKRRRIPLPTYPFERQKYWIEAAAPSLAMPAKFAATKKEDISDWFYLPSWKQTVPARLISPLRAEPCCWLIFVDQQGLSDKLIDMLKSAGHKVVTVKKGSDFKKFNSENYQLSPQLEENYDSLIKELKADESVPQRILHLWNVTETTVPTLASVAEFQALGFYSPVFLAQSLIKQSINEQIQITIFTSNLYEVTGKEDIQPEKALIIGPLRVLPQEFPNISCRNIDIDISDLASPHISFLLMRLKEELFITDKEPTVAYRHNLRWQPDYQGFHLNEAVKQGLPFKKGGVYLITGGMGGIGQTIATYLASTFQAKLALVARSPLPAREDWAQWCTDHDETDATTKKIGKLAELEHVGGEVMVLCADVANYQEMNDSVVQVQARFGAINGVIHTAGVAGGGMALIKTAKIADAVFAPKITGSMVLFDLFQHTNLDLFVLCSGMVSLAGGFGQIDYCSANAFQDQFSHYLFNKRGVPSQTINWDAWREVGMAANTLVPTDLAKLRTFLGQDDETGLLPEEGLDAFCRSLASALPQVIISTKELTPIIEQMRNLQPMNSLQQMAGGDLSGARHERPDLGIEYVAPRNEVEQTIAEIWQNLLGITEIGIHDNFFSLGGHSLLAIRIIAQLRDAFKIDMQLKDIFETPTIAELALTIVQSQAQNVDDELLAQLLAELEE